LRDRLHGHAYVVLRRPLKIQRRNHASEPQRRDAPTPPSSSRGLGWDPAAAGGEMGRTAARVRGVYLASICSIS
jgi:hypothetical protein